MRKLGTHSNKGIWGVAFNISNLLLTAASGAKRHLGNIEVPLDIMNAGDGVSSDNMYEHQENLFADLYICILHAASIS